MNRMILKHYLVSLLFPITSSICGIFVANALSRSLGIETYGQFLAYSAFFSIVSSIVDFQFQNVLVKGLNDRVFGKNDIWTIAIIRAIPLSLGLLYCAWESLGAFMNGKNLLPYVILGMSLVFIPAHFDWYFVARMKFGYLSILKASATLVQSIVVIASVQHFADPVAPLLAQLVVFIVYTVVCLKSSGISPFPFNTSFDKVLAKRVFQGAFLLAITQIVCNFGFNYATILAYKSFPSFQSSALFASAQKLSLFLMSFSVPLINVFTSAILNRRVNQSVLRIIVLPTSLSIIGIILFYFFGMDLFSLLFSISMDDLASMPIANKYMILSIGSVGIFAFSRAPAISFLLAHGSYKKYAFCNGVPSILGFISMSLFSSRGDFWGLVSSAVLIEFTATLVTIGTVLPSLTATAHRRLARQFAGS